MKDAGGSNGGQGATPDALAAQNQALRDRLAAVEAERASLAARLVAAETENRQWVEQYVASEQQRSDLSHLYAATQALSTRGTRADIVETIRQVITNLVGSEDMAFFETTTDGNALSLVANFGDTVPPRNVRFGEGVIGETARRGAVATRADVRDAADEPEIAACIPLMARGQVVGAIALFRLLPQKAGLVALDERLFEVVSLQGGIAWDEARGAG
jgi:K+-sensing histidine kinase KdpD